MPTVLPHLGTMVSRLKTPELIFMGHNRGLNPTWCLRSAEQAHRGRQRLRKRAMHEDRANPIPINVLSAGSFQTAIVPEGTCNYLSGFKGVQLMQGQCRARKSVGAWRIYFVPPRPHGGLHDIPDGPLTRLSSRYSQALAGRWRSLMPLSPKGVLHFQAAGN